MDIRTLKLISKRLNVIRLAYDELEYNLDYLNRKWKYKDVKDVLAPEITKRIYFNFEHWIKVMDGDSKDIDIKENEIFKYYQTLGILTLANCRFSFEKDNNFTYSIKFPTTEISDDSLCAALDYLDHTLPSSMDLLTITTSYNGNSLIPIEIQYLSSVIIYLDRMRVLLDMRYNHFAKFIGEDTFS